MPFEEVKYEFPHEAEDSKEVEIEETDAVEIDLSGKKTEEDYKNDQAVEPEDEPELEIEVVNDTPEEDQKREEANANSDDVTEEELQSYGKKVQKRINKMQKNINNERRAKEAAERERQELQAVAQKLIDENKGLKGQAAKDKEVLVEQAKRSSAIEVLTAKKQYKDAYEAGDAEKVLEAQDKLTTAKIKADKIKNYQPEPLQEEETPVALPTETQVDTKARDWASRNEWFGKDHEMTQLAYGLHNKLVGEGVDPTSDDYYERIDSRVRQLFPDNFEDAPKKKRANVVAPATRSTAPKKVKLTQTQVTLAKRLGLSLEQYASQLAQDMRNV
tara:strand:+ start:422 stop:1414 length:993 start_codon:yes stop_codon:yes gene_type:complete